MKEFWIAGAICLTIGIIIFAVGAGLHADSVVYQNVEESFGSGIRGISVDCSAEDVYIRPSTDDEYHVFCSGSDKTSFNIEVSDGILTVTSTTEVWDSFLALNFGDGAKITVQMPVKNTEVPVESLTVDTASGDIQVAEGLLFRRCDLSTTSGDITFKGDVQGKMNMETTSGDIYVEDMSLAPAYECILNSTSGTISVKGLNVSALIAETTSGDACLENCDIGALTVNTVSGDVELEGVDADECYIRATSGDVSAGLAEAMDFHCSSTSGDIETPPSAANGGLCQITTTSGDIEVWIYSKNATARSDKK